MIHRGNDMEILPMVLRDEELRRGKWGPEEEAYVSEVIAHFHKGLLNLSPGTTLRQYLSNKLNCDPMRITKKFTGEACIGKCSFLPLKLSTWDSIKEVESAQNHLNALKNIWYEKLFEQEREFLRKATGKQSSDDDKCQSETAEICREKITSGLKYIQSENDTNQVLEWHQICVDALRNDTDCATDLSDLVEKGEKLMDGVRSKFKDHYFSEEYNDENSDEKFRVDDKSLVKYMDGDDTSSFDSSGEVVSSHSISSESPSSPQKDQLQKHSNQSKRKRMVSTASSFKGEASLGRVEDTASRCPSDGDQDTSGIKHVRRQSLASRLKKIQMMQQEHQQRVVMHPIAQESTEEVSVDIVRGQPSESSPAFSAGPANHPPPHDPRAMYYMYGGYPAYMPPSNYEYDFYRTYGQPMGYPPQPNPHYPPSYPHYPYHGYAPQGYYPPHPYSRMEEDAMQADHEYAQYRAERMRNEWRGTPVHGGEHHQVSSEQGIVEESGTRPACSEQDKETDNNTNEELSESAKSREREEEEKRSVNDVLQAMLQLKD
mmetsp:Transcript_23759/g.23974  ORF Transcript_23759/g.23974 Transcript_23759/m.23974 type:complete len:544 (+) Transcript_23759:42-1673(+)